jgi:hypothetical protein
MLIPQFSIRWLLGLTAVCAVVFSVFSLALQGSFWAVGLSAAILSLGAAMIAYAAMFTLVWAFSLLSFARAKRTTGGGSPFASVPPATPGNEKEKEIPAAPIILE